MSGNRISASAHGPHFAISSVPFEIVVAVCVPLSFLVINIAVALLERTIAAFSLLSGNYYLAGIAEGFAMGTIFAQLVIVAIWAGLSPSRVYLRTIYALLALVAGAKLVTAFNSKFAPELLRLRNEWLSEHIPFGWLVLVVIFAAVQLSLFATRVFSGRYLSFPTNEARREVVKRQLSMLELVGLPALVCFPLTVTSLFFEARVGLFMVAIVLAVLVICLAYAALHLVGFLRENLSFATIAVLLLVGPVLLFPVSIYFTGIPIGGTFQGVPFFSVLSAVHLGALTIGIPTALIARRVGFRFRAA